MATEPERAATEEGKKGDAGRKAERIQSAAEMTVKPSILKEIRQFTQNVTPVSKRTGERDREVI